MDLNEAIQAPRMHWESNVLYIEGGFDLEMIDQLNVPDEWTINSWNERNMFFGGVHAVGTENG